MWVLIFSTNVSETFLILRRIKRDIIIHVRRSSCKVLAVFARFQNNLSFRDKFSENTQISSLLKIPPVGDELFHANAQTVMMKLIVGFRDFVKETSRNRWKKFHIIWYYKILQTYRPANWTLIYLLKFSLPRCINWYMNICHHVRWHSYFACLRICVPGPRSCTFPLLSYACGQFLWRPIVALWLWYYRNNCYVYYPSLRAWPKSEGWYTV
jgi:hypothetical protein